MDRVAQHFKVCMDSGEFGFQRWWCKQCRGERNRDAIRLVKIVSILVFAKEISEVEGDCLVDSELDG